MDGQQVNTGVNTTPNWSGLGSADGKPVQVGNKDNPMTEGAQFQSTLSTSEGTLGVKASVYVNPSDKPPLLPTLNDAPSVAEAVLDHLFNFDTIAQGILQFGLAPQTADTEPASPEDSPSAPVEDPDIIALAKRMGIPPAKLLQQI